MRSKILILCPKFYPSIGGVEEQVKLLGESFIKMGYEVDVFTKRTDWNTKKEENIFGINVSRFENEFVLFMWLLKNANKYLFIMSRHYYRNTFVLSILKTLLIVKTRTIICSDSGGDNDEFMRIKKGLGIYHKLYFWIIQHNNHLNCLNRDNEKHLKSIIGDSPKITKIYNGIKFTNKIYPKRKSIKNILFLSRLIQEKGIYETINAFKQIDKSDIILNIVGPGNKAEQNKIKKLIKDDSRILFIGPLYGEKKEFILKKTDLLIFPSYNEGQSILLLEAVKYNIPVITTDISDNKIIFGKNMIYVRPQNTKGLKENIEYIIENINKFDYNYDTIKKKMDIKNTCKAFLNLAFS